MTLDFVRRKTKVILGSAVGNRSAITTSILELDEMVCGLANWHLDERGGAGMAAAGALCSILTYLAAAKTLDFVLHGIDEFTAITIVSERSRDIRQRIMHDLGRGEPVKELSRDRQGAVISPCPSHSLTVAARKIHGLGVTVFQGRGGMTGAELDIIYCVVTRLEIGKVKAIVRDLDPGAFIAFHPLAETVGGQLKRTSLE